MRKKVLAILLIVMVLFMLGGCKKLKEKRAERMKAIEDAKETEPIVENPPAEEESAELDAIFEDPFGDLDASLTEIDGQLVESEADI